MSTSRKLMVKLDTHPRHSPKQRRKEIHLCAHRYTICLLLSLAVRPKIICRTQFVHLYISELTPGSSGTQSQTKPGPSHTQSRQLTPQKRSSGTTRAGAVENFAVACQVPSLKFGQIFTLCQVKETPSHSRS